MVQNRGILITLRAAALVIIATGLGEVLVSAIPGFEPLYLYLACIALVALLDGVLLGFLTAVLAVGFYALLYSPRDGPALTHLAMPVALAFAAVAAGAILRGVFRMARRQTAHPVYTVSPPLLETSAVASVVDNVEVLAAIDDLRNELRTAVSELGSSRMRADELDSIRRSQNAEREAVETRARQLEHDRDWALKTAQADRAAAERERTFRSDLERQLAQAREESAVMAGRVAELEVTVHERDRARVEMAELRRALELERKRAEGEKALREEFSADADKLRTRIGELEEVLSTAAPASEFDELRRALADTRNARDRARAEAMAEKTRAETLERAVATARGEADERVAEERKRADVAVARAAEAEEAIGRERSARHSLEAEVAQFDAKLEAIASRLSAEHEKDLEKAVGEREEARADARAQRMRVAELEAEARQFEAKLETLSSRFTTDHESELEKLLETRDAARADARALSERVAQLESLLARERSTRELLEKQASEFDTRLQTVAANLASGHQADLGHAVAEREEARAEIRMLRTRVAELEASLAEEKETFDARLQTIVTHLASDHEADLGQALGEKEAARAEARSLSMKLTALQRKLDDAESLLAETRRAAQAEIDRMRGQLAIAPAPPPVRPRVLVVHPDPDARGAAGASLERAGYEVVSAGDGLEALRVAIARQPEVVIAESSMPKLGGRELCQLLKSQQKTSHIRFILLMRASDDAPRGELLPDQVLRKPVPVETLRATLAGLLASSN